MNRVLWAIQIVAALLYGSSGVMKVFMFDKISVDVRSFGALPKKAWMTLGVVELICTVGLVVPAALHWNPVLTVAAAAILSVESLLFIWVHVRYKETPTIVMCAMLGAAMAFIAYARMVLAPFA